MKKGTILRVMYQPSYESFFVFRKYSGSDALGVWITKTDKETYFKWSARFPKDDIQNDREHFPIVGFIDLEEMIINHVLNKVSHYKKNEVDYDSK